MLKSDCSYHCSNILLYTDELVCLYQTCKNGDCITQYEVCSEDPNTPVVRSTCHAVFIVDAETGNVTSTKQCFDDPHSECPEKCIPEQHGFITGLHDCCCIGNLCNDVNATGITSCIYMTSVHLSVCLLSTTTVFWA